jgi:glycerol-1-phosphate dehydrogenase [NAD(P)+]
MEASQRQASDLIDRVLACARDTRELQVGSWLLARTPEIFRRQFGSSRAAMVVADPRTFAAAGEAVQAAFVAVGQAIEVPFLYVDRGLYAEEGYVHELERWLQQHDVIPIAVGSGTINDLTKLAAHRAARPYLAVATAASMDGYTAFGASIMFNGSKQTLDCPAPAAVVADLEVIAAAPGELTAAGYADLLAKLTAGADWIIADALGVEPIDRVAWDLVQGSLMESLGKPALVARGDIGAIGRLTRGLMRGGFAMQWAKSSRPASGAEHQFSHLWDMQHHTHEGRTPSHGFQVAIGTLAVARLYECLLAMRLEELDVERAVAAWPSGEQWEARIVELLGEGELAGKARVEMAAKAVEPPALRERLTRLRAVWPELRERLRRHLLPAARLAEMLGAAGAPTCGGEIGISQERLLASFRQAHLIRRRFTVLDLAMQAGVFEACLRRLFGS